MLGGSHGTLNTRAQGVGSTGSGALVFLGLALWSWMPRRAWETKADGNYHFSTTRLPASASRRAIDFFFFLLQIFHCLIGSDTDGWPAPGCHRPSPKNRAFSDFLSLQPVVSSHHSFRRWGQGSGLAACSFHHKRSRSVNPEAPPSASQATPIHRSSVGLEPDTVESVEMSS